MKEVKGQDDGKDQGNVVEVDEGFFEEVCARHGPGHTSSSNSSGKAGCALIDGSYCQVVSAVSSSFARPVFS